MIKFGIMNNLKKIEIVDGVTDGRSFAKDIDDNFTTISGATIQQQVDWNSTSGVTSILNKPNITSGGTIAQVQVDWDAVSGLASILNKPTEFNPTTHTHSDYSLTTHTHTGIYAPVVHTHTGVYAPVIHSHIDYSLTGHTHTGVYAPAVHVHTGVYAPVVHSHTEYSLTGHTHTGVYAPVVHTHSDYSLTTHTHTGVYAPVVHSHTEYSLTGHTHPIIPQLTGDEIVQLIAPKVLRSTLVLLNQNGLNVQWDASQGSLYRLTLSGDTTLNNPTNVVAGAIYQIEVNQDNSGLWILSWGTNFKFPNGDKPIITLDGNASDIITIYAKSATELWVTYVQNFI
jgi:hypothetical protein